MNEPTPQGREWAYGDPRISREQADAVNRDIEAAQSDQEQARKAIEDGGRDSIYAPLHSHYPPASSYPKPKLPKGLIDRGPDRCYDPTAFPGATAGDD